MDRIPPGKDTGVSNRNDGLPPRQCRMRIAVEVNEINALVSSNLLQPSTRSIYIRPGIFHPFELEVRAVQGDVVELSRVGALGRRWHWTHGGDDDLNVASSQCSRKLERIGPHSSDCVGCHQKLHA